MTRHPAAGPAASPRPDAPADPGAAFRAPLPATLRALAHRVAVGQSEGRAPALVATVVRAGAPVWSAGAGELPAGVAPERVRFRIGSITKTLTAVLVLRLRDEGLLDLDQPVGRWLTTPHGGDATVAQLLSHTAGLAAEARAPWWERTPGELRPELPDVFGPDPVIHPAGRRYHYSNPGYALLGALVERLRGEPWFTVLRREVLLPLGMSRTSYAAEEPAVRGWAVHPYADLRQPEPMVDTGRMAPAGQLWSTTEDLGRFAAFLLTGEATTGGQATTDGQAANGDQGTNGDHGGEDTSGANRAGRCSAPPAWPSCGPRRRRPSRPTGSPVTASACNWSPRTAGPTWGTAARCRASSPASGVTRGRERPPRCWPMPPRGRRSGRWPGGCWPTCASGSPRSRRPGGRRPTWTGSCCR
ncbi:serine hydrolase domain-containing protein [Streptomyces sp. DSM 44915]|uniref:Serine hydrolase domain-containing protein n=1 Tax=Streptomyces chisholmiae TaxID=3075540 RepID=A0ABU2JQQ6_9ACTN|nr:serine hydrolase domain-containing protein [Streptomyces sp. DSM 44915]MDT0267073.1 serine hydrolase domain-containing protein [Streptomyces sp. DSM 44915]